MSPCDGRAASYSALKDTECSKTTVHLVPIPVLDPNGLMLQERLFTLPCFLAPNPQKMPRVTVLAGQR